MPVKTMARPRSSAASITSASRIEPPGWITAVAPASAAAMQPVGEGEEGVGGHDRALGAAAALARSLRGVLALSGGDARGIDAAHLPGADADRGARPWHRRWRSTSRAWRRGRRRAGRRSSALVGARLVTTLRSRAADAAGVARLHQKPAGQRPHDQPRRRRVGHAAGQQQAQVLLRREQRRAPRHRRPGAITTSVKRSPSAAAVAGVQRPVHRDDAAEGRDRIAGERALARPSARSSRHRHAAGIGVLDDDDRRLVELGRTARRRRRCR